MADMELVIKIPKELYQLCRSCLGDADCIESAIANGTPLPKGHGRLIDESNLIPDSDYEDGMFYAVSIGQINSVPAIIKADKETADETGN